MRRQVQSGQYRDLDYLLTKELDALEGKKRRQIAPGATTEVLLDAKTDFSKGHDTDVKLTSPSVRGRNVQFWNAVGFRASDKIFVSTNHAIRAQHRAPIVDGTGPKDRQYLLPD